MHLFIPMHTTCLILPLLITQRTAAKQKFQNTSLKDIFCLFHVWLRCISLYMGEVYKLCFKIMLIGF